MVDVRLGDKGIGGYRVEGFEGFSTFVSLLDAGDSVDRAIYLCIVYV